MSHDLRHVMKVAERPSVVMAEGQGSWLRDRDGKEYLDFVQGWAVNCLGHCWSPIPSTGPSTRAWSSDTSRRPMLSAQRPRNGSPHGARPAAMS